MGALNLAQSSVGALDPHGAPGILDDLLPVDLFHVLIEMV